MTPDEQDRDILSQLPQKLQYLIEPALNYQLEGEFDIWPVLDQMTPQQRTELETIGATVLENDHYEKVNTFLDEYPIDKHDEAAHLYFLFGLMDHADIQFDQAPDDP